MKQYLLKHGKEPVLPELRLGTTDLVALPRKDVTVTAVFAPTNTPIMVYDGDHAEAPPITSLMVLRGWAHVVTWSSHFPIRRFNVDLQGNGEVAPGVTYTSSGRFEVDPHDRDTYLNEPALSGILQYWWSKIATKQVSLLRLQRQRPALVVGEVSEAADPGWLDTDDGRYFVRPDSLIVREFDGSGARVMQPAAMRYEFSGLWSPDQTRIVTYDSPA